MIKADFWGEQPFRFRRHVLKKCDRPHSASVDQDRGHTNETVFHPFIIICVFLVGFTFLILRIGRLTSGIKISSTLIETFFSPCTPLLRYFTVAFWSLSRTVFMLLLECPQKRKTVNRKRERGNIGSNKTMESRVTGVRDFSLSFFFDPTIAWRANSSLA